MHTPARPFGLKSLTDGLHIEVRHSRLTTILPTKDAGLSQDQRESKFGGLTFYSTLDQVPLIEGLESIDRLRLADQWTDNKQNSHVYKIRLEKYKPEKLGLTSLSNIHSSFDAELKLMAKLSTKQLRRELDLGDSELVLETRPHNGSESSVTWPYDLILFVMTDKGVVPAQLLYPNHQYVPERPLKIQRTQFFSHIVEISSQACQADCQYIELEPALWKNVVGVVHVCSNSPGIRVLHKISGGSANDTTVWSSSEANTQDFRRIVLEKVLNRLSANL